MGHLNDIHENYDGKGLTVLSVSGESPEVVQGFVEELGAEYPIMCRAQSSAYSTGGIPSAYLIGADGTVLWQGHPSGLSDSDLEEHLRDVAKSDRVSTWAFTLSKQLPENLPAKLSGAVKSLEKMKFGAALKAVETALPRLEGDEKEAAETFRDWVAKSGTTMMEDAASLVRANEIYKAYVVYGKVEDRFKGHAMAKDAKDAAKALKSGKETGLEIKASQKLEKIKTELRGEKDFEDQLKCLKPLLGKKYADTVAGQQAADLAKKIEAKIPAK